MKKILSAVLGIFLMTAILSSCKDTSLVNSVGPKGTTANAGANPAITFVGGDAQNNGAIWVTNSDGTNASLVYSCKPGLFPSSPTWSPDGGSLSFTESDFANPTKENNLLTIDVSVSNNGVPKSSHPNTILNYNSNSGLSLRGQAWCKASGVHKIAYIAHSDTREVLCTITDNGQAHGLELYSISSTEGSFYKDNAINYFAQQLIGGWYNDNTASVTWSPDGSKIAFVAKDASNMLSIKVVDANTGTLLATPVSGVPAPAAGYTGGIFCLRWSNTGLNKLAYTDGEEIYIVDPIDGATPQDRFTFLSSMTGGQINHIYWAPDNSSFLMDGGPSVWREYKVYGPADAPDSWNADALAGGGTNPYAGDWK